MLRQILLAIGLIAVPVGLFTAFELATRPAAGNLGDLTAMTVIVTDVRSLTDSGDLAGAARRITDLETAWDDAQPALQPRAPVVWGALDGRIDSALTALRAEAPDGAKVDAALGDLSAALADPATAVGGGEVAMVAGIAVTDAAGHPLPCEAMLASLRAAAVANPPTGPNVAKVADLQTQATERCNADDDAHADALSAQGLALISK